MAELVNLNKARKAKARADREAQAGANRAKFGRTKAERLRDEAEAAQARQKIDSHRMDQDD